MTKQTQQRRALDRRTRSSRGKASPREERFPTPAELGEKRDPWSFLDDAPYVSPFTFLDA